MGGIRPMGMFGSRGSPPPPHIGQGAHPGLSPFTPTSEMLHFDLGLKVRREREVGQGATEPSSFYCSDWRSWTDLLCVRRYQLGQTLRHPGL